MELLHVSQSQKRSILVVLLLLLAVTVTVYSAETATKDEELDMEAEDSASSERFLLVSGQDSIGALFPLTTWDYIGFCASILGLIISAGGGIGGGGIIMPIYILIMHFPVKRAIPLVNVTVFGGAIANTIFNVTGRHPIADRPLIDWDLILVLEPMAMAGAPVGAILAKLLPKIVVVILLVAVLTSTSYKTLQKAMQLYQQESDERKDLGYTTIQSLLLDTDEETNKSSRKERTMEASNEQDIELEEMCPREKTALLKTNYAAASSWTFSRDDDMLSNILEHERYTPPFNVALTSVSFFVVVSATILKGGGSFPSPLGIRCGSPSYWAAEGVILLSILAVMYAARQHLIRKTNLKSQAKCKYIEGDIVWDERATLIYPSISFVAGVIAGLFGLGGGMGEFLNCL